MSMNLNHKDGKYYGPLFMTDFKIESIAFDATADLPIDPSWPPVLLVDPAGGAKTILLPVEADSKNKVFFIINTADGAETLTVEEDGASTTILSLAQNKSGAVHCDGTTWRSMFALA